MKMINIRLSIALVMTFLCGSQNVIAQEFYESNEKNEVYYEDYNYDGFPDSVYLKKELGKDFFGVNLKIKNGKDGKEFEFESTFSDKDILNLVELPPFLYNTENQGFIRIFDREVFKLPEDSLDNSLKWLLEGLYSKIVPEHNYYFDLILRFQPRWSNVLTFPHNYKLLVNLDSLCEFIKCDEIYQNTTDQKKAWIIYTADNMYLESNLNKIGKERLRTKALKIYSNKHGVLIEANHKYCWVFINDGQVTESQNILRWASIGAVCSYENYIFLVQKNYNEKSNKVFIIDYKTGVCVRLSDKIRNGKTITGISINKKEKNLILSFDTSIQKVPLEALLRTIP